MRCKRQSQARDNQYLTKAHNTTVHAYFLIEDIWTAPALVCHGGQYSTPWRIRIVYFHHTLIPLWEAHGMACMGLNNLGNEEIDARWRDTPCITNGPGIQGGGSHFLYAGVRYEKEAFIRRSGMSGRNDFDFDYNFLPRQLLCTF